MDDTISKIVITYTDEYQLVLFAIKDPVVENGILIVEEKQSSHIIPLFNVRDVEMS